MQYQKEQETDFASRLKALRKRMKLTQTAFSALGGVSKGSQVAYEQGQTEPSVSYLNGLSAAGINVLYLLTGERFDPGDASDDFYRLLATYLKLPPAAREAVVDHARYQMWKAFPPDAIDRFEKSQEDLAADAEMIEAGLKALSAGKLDQIMRKSREALRELRDAEQDEDTH